MKIVTVLGSPRRRGNTAAVLGLFEDLIPAPNRVERIKIADYAVSGCLGCGACQVDAAVPGCIQRDDGDALLKRLMKADAIVYATPLYVWGFTAQMKAFLDRHYCMVKPACGQGPRSLLKDKRAALLVTCGDRSEEKADLIKGIFEREMSYLGCRIAGMYVVPGCTTPDKLGPQGALVAERMARDIMADPPSRG